MLDWTNIEPLHLHMFISLFQIIILVVLAIIAASHSNVVPTIDYTPVNGNWSWFTDNTTCSVSCDGGHNLQFRKCSNPPPMNGGTTCPGPSSRVVACNSNNCPINGGWGLWVDNGTCTVTCGGGKRTLYRNCNYPAPAYGGRFCVGSDTIVLNCNNNSCPVNGSWGSWISDLACTKSCGGGLSAFVRHCDSPSPSFCGSLCTGNSSQILACNSFPCPIDGNWTDWVDGVCSVTCGGGTMIMIRSCTNPQPQFGGENCLGSPTQTLTCNNQNCPVNGNWGAWQDTTPCSASCGTGGKLQVRTCNSPTAAYCGKTCSGNASQIVTCQSTMPCPACVTNAYTKDNGSNVCGFFFPTALNFLDSVKTCQYYGALLPEVRSIRENNLILTYRPPNVQIWLNSNDLAQRHTYVW